MNPVPVHACNPGPMTGEGNWTWFVPGAVPTLIDAGTGEAGHLDAVVAALSGARLAQVIVTHAHGDHASGALHLAARFDGVRFLKMPWPERDSRWPVAWEPLEDAQTIAAGDGTLQVLHTPGHAPDHLCLWHADSRVLYSSDLAIKGTTVYIPTTMGGDLAEYLESIRSVLALQPARMLPAHGPVIEDPDRLLRSYLEHRQQREDQILAGFVDGVCTVEALVPLVYRGLKEPLVKAARETILAHLIKLEREGRVGRRAEAWHIIEP